MNSIDRIGERIGWDWTRLRELSDGELGEAIRANAQEGEAWAHIMCAAAGDNGATIETAIAEAAALAPDRLAKRARRALAKVHDGKCPSIAQTAAVVVCLRAEFVELTQDAERRGSVQ